MRIKISQCLEDGAKLYTANFKKLVLVSLVALYLMLVSGLLFAGVAIIGMLMFIAALDNGEDVSNGIPYLFKGFKYFVPSVLIHLSIFAIIIIIAYLGHLLKSDFLYFIAFIVAFSIGIGVMYSLFLIYERDMNFIDACKSSFELVKRDVFGSFLLLIIVKMIGGSLLLWHSISKRGHGSMIIPVVAMMVFMLPLALCIYYKGYKMLTSDLAKDITRDEKLATEESESVDKGESFAKKNIENISSEIENERKGAEVLVPEVLSPEDDEHFGV